MLLNFFVDHTQITTGWALLQRAGFVLGTVTSPTAVSMLTPGRGRQSWAQPWEWFAGFGPWGRAGVQELLFPLGHHKAQHKGLSGERLIGELKARQTQWQHVKLGPQAHLCTLCQCHPQCHHWAFWTWAMSSVQFDFWLQTSQLIMWYLGLMLFIPCSLTWAEPKLPWHGGYPHGVLQPGLSSRRVLPAFEWEPLIQHPTYFTIPPLLEQQDLRIFPGYIGKIYLLDFLERTW